MTYNLTIPTKYINLEVRDVDERMYRFLELSTGFFNKVGESSFIVDHYSNCLALQIFQVRELSAEQPHILLTLRRECDFFTLTMSDVLKT